MLGETIHITFEYLIHEEKAVMAGSKVEALEAEGSKLSTFTASKFGFTMSLPIYLVDLVPPIITTPPKLPYHHL